MNPSIEFELRPPEQIMRLKRLGSFHQSRLSFMRVLTRRMASESWRFSLAQFAIDANNEGHAVYTVHTPNRNYSLLAFAHKIPDAMRSDRVIAEVWDATFCLFDGIPTADDVARLSAQVPLQEGARLSEKELTLSRANRSVRLWNNVVSSLAQGRQPDLKALDEVGYLMRTTAVYGSGKFGAADREMIKERPEMSAPFQAEMLTVYLIRLFVRDLVNHSAAMEGGDRAIPLSPTLARQLGIGNSTGLGMAPFLVNHPVLLNNWIMAREQAISRVRSIKRASTDELELFNNVLHSAKALVDQWWSDHPVQSAKLRRLRQDIQRITFYKKNADERSDYVWHKLINWSANALSEEGQELLASLILEPYPEQVDYLAATMSDNTTQQRIDGSMTVKQVRKLLEDQFGWALEVNWSLPEHSARLWYVSKEKLEPRLAERFDEPLAEFEQPLAPARDAAMAYTELNAWKPNQPIANFLLKHPEHRHSIRRAQLTSTAPYAEICDNTIAAKLLPIDMLRAKLSFFGATRFDPRSDRWIRICMFGGAPYPEELNVENSDRWVYPSSCTH